MAALILASSVAGMAIPYTFALVIDGVQAGWSLRDILLFGVGSTLVALVLRSAFECAHAAIRIRELESVMLWRFRYLAAEKVCGFSVGQTQNENSGFRQSVLSRGVSSAEQVVQVILHDLWPMLTTVLVVSVALFVAVPWWLALSTFAVGGLQVVYRIWLNASYIPTLRGFAKEDTRLDKRMTEFMRNVGTAILDGQATRLLADQDGKRLEFLSRENEFWVTHVWRVFGTDVAAITLRCALFGFASWLAIGGSMTVGMFLVYVSWSGQLLASLDRFGQIFRSLARAAPHVSRLEEMLAIQPAVREPANPYFPEGDVRGEVEFRNVSFVYPTVSFEGMEDGEEPEERQALVGVSFRVMPGERVALVGRSGAGKSTAAKLLGRTFDPDGGEILVDGVDLRSWDLSRLRARIGYVEQEVTLFDFSVGENIALAVGGDLSKIGGLDAVLQQSRVSDFIERLGDKGLNSKIGERGIKLSGGERARIGIARAFAKEPRIVIFDEATAALDAENERAVYEAIFGEGLSGITAIIIAHNLRTIRRADRIVFFEGGSVIATGTHDELMASCESYRTLVELHQYDDE